jgi:ABC-type multidrug transport system fused ATPase/permease subunit
MLSARRFCGSDGVVPRACRASIAVLPVLLLIQIVFTAGIALLFAMANLFLRDVKYIFEMVLTVWMFATSVVYPLDRVQGTLGALLRLNPMSPNHRRLRATILRGEMPALGPLALAADWRRHARDRLGRFPSRGIPVRGERLVGQPAIVFDGVSKKFNRAQRFNSIRDLVPAMVSGLFGRKKTRASCTARSSGRCTTCRSRCAPGEALGIIGPNGAGKSTALKILTRILRPDRGVAAVHGRVGALVEIAAGFHPDSDRP